MTRRASQALYRHRRIAVAVAVAVGVIQGVGVLRGQAKSSTGASVPNLAGASSAKPSPRPDPSKRPTPSSSPTTSSSPTAPNAQPRPVVSAADKFAPAGSVLLKVPVQNQLPELPNGCEATSLAMLLTAQGTPVSKLVLANEQPTNAVQPVFAGKPGDFYTITRWNNPNEAFVGNVRGKYGYGIYHGPLARLLNDKTQGKALDLTGRRFSEILDQLRGGTPIVLWTTTTFKPPTRWVTWATPEGPFRATQIEHAVLLVGYTKTRLIINNPLTGRQEQVAPRPFIAAWQQMGRQALTYRP